MKLDSILESAWAPRRQALRSKISLAAQHVGDMLDADRRQRGRSDGSRLESHLGTLAGSALDLSSLSQVLEQRNQGRSLAPEHRQRLDALHADLCALRDQFDESIPAAVICPLGSRNEILEKAARHLEAMAQVLRRVRQAELEQQYLFDAAVHTAFFAEFTWEHLNAAELSLCPPFVLTVESVQVRAAWFEIVLPLLTSGLPLKMILECTEFPLQGKGLGLSSALRTSLETEMLPVALKSVYVLQDTVARSSTVDRLQKALVSPRPALAHLLNDSDSERCAQAVASRAFPVFTYDPDASEVFLKRFDLQGNPDSGQIWANTSLEHINAAGKKDLLQTVRTFADFAAGEAAYQDQFTPLPAAQAERAVELHRWLDLSPAERQGHLPFIRTRTAHNTLVSVVPSMGVVALAAEKAQLWKALCEMSGVNNPYLAELEKRLREQAAQEKAQALAQARSHWKTQLVAEREKAVQEALGRLAQRLVGGVTNGVQSPSISGAGIVSAAAPASTATPIATAAAPAAPNGDGSWIESKSCTACDECVTIDPRIFAYDKNKQAYIKDPKGGPYKNIVKAAKMCSARIIHPGIEK